MRTFRIRPRRAAQRSRCASRRRVEVEALESRQLLATFPVLNNLDSGPGSFRQAILDANAFPNANSIPDDIPFIISPIAQRSPSSAFPVDVGGFPVDIVTGPDGNLYFTDRNASTPRIGRIGLDGTVTSFPLAPGSIPIAITTNPDGNLYFTDRNPANPRVGRITTAGAITSLPLPASSSPNQITTGPDGNLYFTGIISGFPSLGRFTTSGVLTVVVQNLLTPEGVTTGPDGNLWLTNGGFINRVSVNGDSTAFLLGGNFGAITLGSDNNLWFTDSGPIPRIGRITPSGEATFFPLEVDDIPVDITSAPDGNLYYTVAGPNRRVSQITTAGVMQDFVFPDSSSPTAITPGPDGNLNFTESDGGRIGRFGLASFNFGSATTIRLASPLPAITEAVDIDGYTQAGAVRNFTLNTDDEETDVAILPVQVDGGAIDRALFPTADGLRITGPNSEVSGLSITGFAGAGIALEGTAAVGNTLEGNFIGIYLGTTLFDRSPNPPSIFSNGEGIRISGSNNRIGGTLPPSRNVIQGNLGAGVSILGPGGTGNLIEGNYVLDNGGDGVRITTSNNFIGEAIGAGPAGGGNIISGNGLRGVAILGIPAQGNILVNNEIGTNVGIAGANPPVRGLSPRPNALEGVLIQDAPNNVVGGLTENSRNAIAANGTDGVRIQGPLATNNRVLSNYIGFNLRGGVVASLPNRDGVNITSANNTIGGTTEAARNIISTNSRHGVNISGPAATGNRVAGNFIGTIGGGDDFGNTFQGVLISNANDNVIGGTEAEAFNVISGNNHGVLITGAGASGNLVLGNFIGTALDGVTDLGNAVDGVQINNSPRNTIGGTAAGARNVISGNDRGVRLTGTGATDNLVLGNFIGTDLTGTLPLGNSHDGVLLTSIIPDNPSGGTPPGAGNAIIGNTIAFNVDSGVLVQSGTGNPILFNRIFSNTLLGIDLGGDGVTPNDLGDADVGPDNRQNFPVLTAAISDGSSTTIQATLNSTPSTTFTLEFFSSFQADPSNFGEGQTPLGTIPVTTDAAGNATVNLTVAGTLILGPFLTATATSPGGDTSEFSNAVTSLPVMLQFSAATFTVAEGGGMATITVTRTGGTGGTVAVNFATANGTATGGGDYTPTSGTLTFNPGEVNRTFTIPILQDDLVEGNETVSLTLSGPTNSSTLAAPSSATLTIVDDDQLSLQFSVAGVAVSEGAGVATIAVIRSGDIGTATIDFTTANGTATAGADYFSTAGTLTFNPGETIQTITVPILQDDLIEGDEAFLVTLSNATGAILGTTNTVTITIVDDDQAGTIQFSQADYVVSEGQAMALITVTRTGGAGGIVTIPFATTDGTAAAGADYAPASGVLTFGPGVTVQSFLVPIVNDPFVEPNETVNLLLGAPSGGATLGAPATATLTIVNDDVDRSGPVVIDVRTVASGRGITGLVLVFNEALDPARAQDLFNYDLLSEGRDGRFGTFDDAPVPLRSATYDPATFSVLLTPAAPLRTGRFYRIRVNPIVLPVAGRNLTDAAGNLLDGNLDGIPGGTYVALIGRGVNLKYFDRDGDRIALQLLRGGTLELSRAFNGEANQLRIINPAAGRSQLAGHLRLPRSGSDGRTTIPVILGARGVRNRLRTPPFFIGTISETAVDALLAAGALTP